MFYVEILICNFHNIHLFLIQSMFIICAKVEYDICNLIICKIVVNNIFESNATTIPSALIYKIQIYLLQRLIKILHYFL